MLTFREELAVLLADDGRGPPRTVPRANVERAFAAAALMDLAFANRIDTDLTTLAVVDTAATGDPVLDHVLAKVGARAEATDTCSWIETLAAEDAAFIHERTFLRLVERGLLELRQGAFRWAFAVRRGLPDDRKRRSARPFGSRRHREATREVWQRIGEAVLHEEIPDPHDAALIALVDSCDLFDGVFPGRDIGHVRARVEQLRRMDLIGRELGAAVSNIGDSAKMPPCREPSRLPS